MDTLPRFTDDTGFQLPVGVLKVMQIPARQETTHEVFHSGLDPAFLLWVSRRARSELEIVGFRELCVGSLLFGIADARFGDRALGVVEDDALGHTAEEAKGSLVAR